MESYVAKILKQESDNEEVKEKARSSTGTEERTSFTEVPSRGHQGMNNELGLLCS